eukprot:1159906-Pelagomonas_calceolata.AAC.3
MGQGQQQQQNSKECTASHTWFPSRHLCYSTTKFPHSPEQILALTLSMRAVLRACRSTSATASKWSHTYIGTGI